MDVKNGGLGTGGISPLINIHLVFIIIFAKIGHVRRDLVSALRSHRPTAGRLLTKSRPDCQNKREKKEMEVLNAHRVILRHDPDTPAISETRQELRIDR